MTEVWPGGLPLGVTVESVADAGLLCRWGLCVGWLAELRVEEGSGSNNIPSQESQHHCPPLKLRQRSNFMLISVDEISFFFFSFYKFYFFHLETR